MPISGEVYRHIGRSAAGGVSVVAAFDGASDRVVGLTASSFVTLSFDPPLVMFAIQHDASCYPALTSSEAFGVSLLTVYQSNIARRFATKGVDKNASTRFEPGQVLRVPLIADSLAQIECRTHEIFAGGDHAVVVGLVEAARPREGEPLLYFARKFGSFVPLPET